MKEKLMNYLSEAFGEEYKQFANDQFVDAIIDSMSADLGVSTELQKAIVDKQEMKFYDCVTTFLDGQPEAGVTDVNTAIENWRSQIQLESSPTRQLLNDIIQSVDGSMQARRATVGPLAPGSKISIPSRVHDAIRASRPLPTHVKTPIAAPTAPTPVHTLAPTTPVHTFAAPSPLPAKPLAASPTAPSPVIPTPVHTVAAPLLTVPSTSLSDAESKLRAAVASAVSKAYQKYESRASKAEDIISRDELTNELLWKISEKFTVPNRDEQIGTYLEGIERSEFNPELKKQEDLASIAGIILHDVIVENEKAVKTHEVQSVKAAFEFALKKQSVEGVSDREKAENRAVFQGAISSAKQQAFAVLRDTNASASQKHAVYSEARKGMKNLLAPNKWELIKTYVSLEKELDKAIKKRDSRAGEIEYDMRRIMGRLSPGERAATEFLSEMESIKPSIWQRMTSKVRNAATAFMDAVKHSAQSKGKAYERQDAELKVKQDSAIKSWGQAEARAEKILHDTGQKPLPEDLDLKGVQEYKKSTLPEAMRDVTTHDKGEKVAALEKAFENFSDKDPAKAAKALKEIGKILADKDPILYRARKHFEKIYDGRSDANPEDHQYILDAAARIGADRFFLQDEISGSVAFSKNAENLEKDIKDAIKYAERAEVLVSAKQEALGVNKGAMSDLSYKFKEKLKTDKEKKQKTQQDREVKIVQAGKQKVRDQLFANTTRVTGPYNPSAPVITGPRSGDLSRGGGGRGGY